MQTIALLNVLIPLKRWMRGSRNRIIATLVNLAKEFGVVKEVAVQLVDALGDGVDTPGHEVGPWDRVPCPCDDQKASVNEPDFAENIFLASPDRPPPYEVRRVEQGPYWPTAEVRTP